MRNSSSTERKPRKSNHYVEVKDVKSLGNYQLEVRLTDGTIVKRDLSRFVKRHAIGIRSRLKDHGFFRRARPRQGTVVWSKDIDICPYLLIWQSCPAPGNKTPKKFAAI